MSSRAESPGITCTIDRAKIESAVAVVRREALVTRRFHRFFVGSGLALAGSLILAILAAIVRWSTSSPETHSVLDFVGILIFVAAIFSFLFLIGSFAFDLALPAVHAWFSRSLRKLGLAGLAVSAPLTLKTGLLRALSAIVGILGGVCLLGAVAVTLVSVISGPPEHAGSDVGVTGVLLALGAMAVWPFVSRWRRNGGMLRRLNEVAGRMTANLSRDQSAVLRINISDLNVMARAEATQIEVERKEALRESHSGPDSQHYALRSSRAVLEQTLALNPQAQVLAQEQMTRLTRERTPPGAAWDEAANVWRLAVPGADVLISYGIDDERREVRLISVVSPSTSDKSREVAA